MGLRDVVKGIRYQEMFVLRIGLMHVNYSMYFDYLLLFVTYPLSLGKLGDRLLHPILSVTHCISAELLYVYQTVGVFIRNWIPN